MSNFVSSLLAAAMAAIIATSSTIYALGRETPTRDEVVDLIRVQAPYNQDRSLILHRLKRIEDKVDQILKR